MAKLSISPLDPQTLVRVQVFTDEKHGALQKIIPITIDGDFDLLRPVVWRGFTQLRTTKGQIDLVFPIPATSFAEAYSKWQSLCQEACAKAVDQLESKAVREAILDPSKVRKQ